MGGRYLIPYYPLAEVIIALQSCYEKSVLTLVGTMYVQNYWVRGRGGGIIIPHKVNFTIFFKQTNDLFDIQW